MKLKTVSKTKVVKKFQCLVLFMSISTYFDRFAMQRQNALTVELAEYIKTKKRIFHKSCYGHHIHEKKDVCHLHFLSTWVSKVMYLFYRNMKISEVTAKVFFHFISKFLTSKCRMLVLVRVQCLFLKVSDYFWKRWWFHTCLEKFSKEICTQLSVSKKG